MRQKYGMIVLAMVTVICLSMSMWPRASASPDPLNVSWYVTDASNAPIDGASLTIHWATSASGPFTAMPPSVVEDKIANTFQNPITTGYWNPAHPHGMALADLHITSVSSYYFYVVVQYGTYVWYWPMASSYKPGDSTWQPVTASGSPSGYAASGNGFGNGPSTAFPTQQPPVLHPGISVTKSGPVCAHEGDTITYTIEVTNPSSVTMYKVSVIDSLLHDISAAFSPSLTSGASETEIFIYVVPSPQAADVQNSVTVIYQDAQYNQITDTASWTVDILHPAMDVAKSGLTNAHEGDLITYTITVTNTGDCPLVGVSVTDPTLSFSWTGDLDTGATTTFHPSYVIPHPSTVISNTVTASGRDILGLSVSDTASWTVDVLHPDILVSKSGPLYAHVGDTIAYTITVSNPSTETMTKVSVIDSLLGDVSGSFSASLAAGASESKTFTYTVPSPSGIILNTLAVIYKNSINQPKTDSSSWAITVLHPAIDVTKSGPTQVHVGETITYTITVTNTGDCKLYGVTVTDPALAFSWTGDLEIAASMTFHPTYTVPTPSGDVSNAVTASGHDNLGGVRGTVTDSASLTVTITALPSPLVGGEWAPTNKSDLLAPWISLASLMTVITVSFVYVERKKKQQK